MRNMKSKAIAVFMLFVAVSLAPAVASAQPEVDHQKPWRVLQFFERSDGTVAFIDLGAPGPGIGDRLVFSSPIFDTTGQRIGQDGADCVIVRIDPTQPPARQQIVQCTISVQLPDGQITVQGLAQGTENYFAITGGTGAYRQAKGEVLAVDIVPLVEAQITVWLYR